MISDWTSLKGRIWRDKVLENGTKAVIGQIMERMCAAVSLGGALRDIPKNGCEGDYLYHSMPRFSHCAALFQGWRIFSNAPPLSQ